jgi:hypothetical protein
MEIIFLTTLTRMVLELIDNQGEGKVAIRETFLTTVAAHFDSLLNSSPPDKMHLLLGQAKMLCETNWSQRAEWHTLNSDAMLYLTVKHSDLLNVEPQQVICDLFIMVRSLAQQVSSLRYAVDHMYAALPPVTYQVSGHDEPEMLQDPPHTPSMVTISSADDYPPLPTKTIEPITSVPLSATVDAPPKPPSTRSAPDVSPPQKMTGMKTKTPTPVPTKLLGKLTEALYTRADALSYTVPTRQLEAIAAKTGERKAALVNEHIQLIQHCVSADELQRALALITT